MSFRMTGNITVAGYEPFKCSSAKWRKSMDNICDTAEFIIPAICAKVDSDGQRYDNLATGLQLKVGQKVTMEFGYNGDNKVRFKGFISRINFTTPLKVECEGYAYTLKNNRHSIGATNISLKEILATIVHGTGIKLSKDIPDVIFTKVSFSKYTGQQVLQWLKEKALQTVYFNFDELYVGLRYTRNGSNQIKHKLGWNTIRNDELLYEHHEAAKVNIVLTQRKETGHHVKVHSGKPGDKKELHLHGIDINSEYAKELRNDLQTKNDFISYAGSITAFLEPICNINDVSIIIDNKYKEREGRYVIESLEGSFGPQGGRQKIGIGAKV